MGSTFEGEMGKKLRATTFGRAYYEEHKAAGLDYLHYGPWQQKYGRWFVETMKLKGRTVLDVGCACGSILRGMAEAGAVVQGIDVNEYMVGIAVGATPNLAPILHVMDAVEMAFPDDTFAAVHSAQVAEHWDPEKVPAILKEIHRVTNSGGRFFCCLDTEELYQRQGRKVENEDPTHTCVRPREWWIERFRAARFVDQTSVWKMALDAHGESMSREYDWDYFVLEAL